MRKENQAKLRIGIATGASVDLTGLSSDQIGQIISDRREGESLQGVANRKMPEVRMPNAHWVQNPEKTPEARKVKKNFSTIRPELN
jgi:hypothetical protein